MSPGSPPGPAADAIFDALDFGIAICDAEGRVLGLSQALPGLLGLSRVAALGCIGKSGVDLGLDPAGHPFTDGTHPIARAVATGGPVWGARVRVPRPDGALGWLTLSVDRIPVGRRRGDSLLLASFAPLADEQAREALAQARRVLQVHVAILDSLPMPLALLDANGRIQAVNDAWVRASAAGLSPLHRGDCGATYPPPLTDVDPDLESAMRQLQALLRRSAPGFEYEYQVGGTAVPCWYRMIAIPLTSAAGAVVVHMDVSASKAAEAALTVSETRYRLLSRATSDAVYGCDLPVGPLNWSEAVGHVLGHEAPGTTFDWWAAHLHPDDRAGVLESFTAAIEGSAETWTALYRFRRQDGTYARIADRVYVVRDGGGKATRLIGAMSDVTVRVEAEAKVRRSEAVLNAAQQVARMGSWEWDIAAGTGRWSDGLYRIIGREPGQEAGPAATDLEYCHPADRDRVVAALLRLRSEGAPFDLECRVVRPDGRLRLMHARGAVAGWRDGRPTYAIGTIQDVTDAREAERKLVEREARLAVINDIALGLRTGMGSDDVVALAVRRLHEHLRDCRVSYSTLSPDGRGRVLCSHQPAEMDDLTGREIDLGLAPRFLEALRGRGPLRFEHPDSDSRLRPALGGLPLNSATALAMPLQHGERLMGVLGLAAPTDRSWGDHEVAMLREVGDYLTVALAEVIAQEARGEALCELETSRAQLRELARELQAAREAERSHIAREIHDVVGQALTALRMELGLLLRGAKPLREEGRRLLQLIDVTLDAVRRLATDLRPSQLDDLDLRAAIQWEMIGFEARSGIRCECLLPEGALEVALPQATAAFRVLQEALTNVARHAGARQVRVVLTVSAGELEMEVRDDGRGVTPEALADPASLGVLGMRERALALDGRLEITGEPGRGTRLVLSLPNASAPKGERE